MISILIPVYNQDVNNLVARLSAGLSHLQGEAEIIVMDDASNQATLLTNAPIAALPGVRCVPQFNNQGRTRMRQLLAREAKGAWLLFLDGDSGIRDDGFLRRYEDALLAMGLSANPATGLSANLAINPSTNPPTGSTASPAINPSANSPTGSAVNPTVNLSANPATGSAANPAVIVGGRIYQSHPPADPALRLHWKYGSVREKREPGKQHQPAFMTNNFLVQAKVFGKLDFGTDWEGYGHEDSWIGLQLEQAEIPIVYIDNPVIHEGLETADVFIRKSEQALVNLKKMSRVLPADQLARHVKLFRVYRQLQKWRLLWAPVVCCQLLGKAIQRNLRSGRPSLALFDLYRLHYFSKL